MMGSVPDDVPEDPPSLPSVAADTLASGPAGTGKFTEVPDIAGVLQAVMKQLDELRTQIARERAIDQARVDGLLARMSRDPTRSDCAPRGQSAIVPAVYGNDPDAVVCLADPLAGAPLTSGRFHIWLAYK